jgi:putative SOS response-associated peptidase YedK
LVEEGAEFDDILRLADESGDAPDYKYGDVFPGQIVPVLTGTRDARLMRWGFPAPFDRNPFINARSETAASTRTFASAYKNRRCLVPATAYYEWKQLPSGRKEKYEFTYRGRRLLYLAGIFSESGEFAILTRDAAPDYREIHARMPVIIAHERRETWLSDPADACSHAVTELEYRAV